MSEEKENSNKRRVFLQCEELVVELVDDAKSLEELITTGRMLLSELAGLWSRMNQPHAVDECGEAEDGECPEGECPSCDMQRRARAALKESMSKMYS